MQRFVHRPTRGERGFTLIELLVVITILGIISGVVVFAVQGTGDKGKANAVAIDERTIQTAEETFCAQTGRYGSGQELVDANLLSDLPTYHVVEARLDPNGPCNGYKYFINSTEAAGPPPPGKWDLTTPPEMGANGFLVRLADGRVLALGSSLDFTGKVARVWDPVTSLWTTVDEPPVLAVGTAAVLLTDDPSTPQSECSGLVNNCGKVFAYGRHLFDPKAPAGSQWQTLPPGEPGVSPCNICINGDSQFMYVHLKGGVTQCGSNCGKVVIFAFAGAFDTGNFDVYNPKDNSYESKPFPAVAGSLHVDSQAAQLPDGRVLVCCRKGTLVGAAFFDAINLEFTADTPATPPTSRYSRGQGSDPQPPILLPNGEILYSVVTSLPRALGFYKPAVGGPGSWRSGPWCVTSAPFSCRRISSLPDGRVLFVRSSSGDSATTTEALVFSPGSNTWSKTGPLNSTLSYNRDSVLLDPAEGACGPNCNKVLIVGRNTAELYTS